MSPNASTAVEERDTHTAEGRELLRLFWKVLW